MTKTANAPYSAADLDAGMAFIASITTKKASAPKGGLSRMVEELLMDGSLTYRAIEARVKEAFPEAKTTNKSIASVASAMRRNDVDVPRRTMY